MGNTGCHKLKRRTRAKQKTKENRLKRNVSQKGYGRSQVDWKQFIGIK